MASASCPAPEMQQKFSHHQIKGFVLVWLIEEKYSPWLDKTKLGVKVHDSLGEKEMVNKN